VTLHYEQDGETVEVTANRISGDYKSGEYKATIPGDAIAEGSLTYYWTLNDFGNNEVQTDDYTVDVKPGITVGYFEDFETAPVGWTSYGDNDSWEWGVPESGPEAAFSGEKVYATNLSGDYASSMNASLLMPPVDLSDGNAYLQFKHWHDFEKYSSGFAYDFGYVYVSTDQEEWTQHLIVEGTSDGWEDAEVDLSEYSSERIYITFNATSDSSVTREGWYIDDVAISDSSLNLTSKAINKDQKRSVGMMAGLDMIPNKPAVNPALSVPAMPEKGEAAAEKDASLAQLPMAAKVSVLESGRSVNTNPQDGSYALMHATGTFTLKAEAYGFESAEQSVEVAADETSTANFTLQELPQGTIQGTVTDEATGEPVEDATLLLVEDANVTPVQTDADGNYQLTAYEGTYTLKISARGYHGQEAEVTVDGDVTVDFALEPFYMVPGGEIGYDDG
ncbi:DUF3823 domain-containing protein, partial [Ornithinibacillus gellani]|uniref:carboxypeptidase regulatory-like domain-containing protein n=1 Tax=Ornithinibacillus gellani TaxID=2293253 RepID=UPI000F4A9EA2